MSQSHRFKGGTTDEAFTEQCFLWDRGASVGNYSPLDNYQLFFVYILKQVPIFFSCLR